MRIRQNDNVQVISGKDAGKRGKVQHVLTDKNSVLIEGLNMVKRHQKSTANMRQAGIMQKEAPVPLSKVMVICPHCDKPVRVGHRFLEDGRKVRECRRCHETIDL